MGIYVLKNLDRLLLCDSYLVLFQNLGEGFIQLLVYYQRKILGFPLWLNVQTILLAPSLKLSNITKHEGVSKR